MINAIKFSKNLHKLSKNEMKIYHELQKFLNKEQDINISIGSYFHQGKVWFRVFYRYIFNCVLEHLLTTCI